MYGKNELSKNINELVELSEVSLRDKMESEQVHLKYEEKEELKRKKCLREKDSCSR